MENQAPPLFGRRVIPCSAHSLHILVFLPPSEIPSGLEPRGRHEIPPADFGAGFRFRWIPGCTHLSRAIHGDTFQQYRIGMRIETDGRCAASGTVPRAEAPGDDVTPLRGAPLCRRLSTVVPLRGTKADAFAPRCLFRIFASGNRKQRTERQWIGTSPGSHSNR